MGNRTGKPGIRRGERYDVHAGERGAPREDPILVDAGIRGRPANDGAVVLALTRDAEYVARLSARAAPLPVIEYDRNEALTAEPICEWREPARFYRA